MMDQKNYRKEIIIDCLLKDLSHNAKILEVFCGHGYSYRIIKEMKYQNYIGIDNDVMNITQCKTLFRNPNDKKKFIYCDDINEYLKTHKFDVVFCIGPYTNHTLSSIVHSAKSKIFYCIPKMLINQKTNYYSKIGKLSKKLNNDTIFSWKIFDDNNLSGYDKFSIVGINHMSLDLLNNSYLIMRDLVTSILNNVSNDNNKTIVDILSLIVDKYTRYKPEPVVIKKLCKIIDTEYIENNSELHIIVPLDNNFEIEFDTKSFAKHILDKGDIIIINKINYFPSGQCLQIVYV